MAPNVAAADAEARNPPGPGGVTATYLAGGVLPCLTDGDEPAVVTGVRADSTVPSAKVRYFARHVPAQSERKEGKPIDWAPIVSLAGSVERAVQRRELLGEISELKPGERFGLRCPKKRDVAAPIDELIVEVTATRQGARVRDIEVDYRIGRKTGTAPAMMTVEVCGSQVRDADCADMQKD